MKQKNIFILIGGIVAVLLIASIISALRLQQPRSNSDTPSVPQPGTSESSTAPLATSGDITLGVGKTGEVAGLTITFNAFVQDSRCPIDVQCIEAGAVNINVTMKANGAPENRNMPSDEVPYAFGKYQISIIKIEPPRMSKQEISPKDYRITFHIASSR